MDPSNDYSSLEPRLPTTDDLVLLCRLLNEAGAKYLVSIPFADPKLLWRTKQTHRDKDAPDRAFLADLLKQRGEWPVN